MGPVSPPSNASTMRCIVRFTTTEFQIKGDPELFEKSSTRCDAQVKLASGHGERLQSDGPVEYIHEARWEPYRLATLTSFGGKYRGLWSGLSGGLYGCHLDVGQLVTAALA